MKKKWNWLHSFRRDEISRGFTLIEILIAVAIFSIILTVIYGSFSNCVTSIGICRERSDIYQVARLSLDRIAEDISCAFPPKDLDLEDIKFGFTGEDRELDGMPSDTIHFISTAHIKFREGLMNPGLYEIGYYMDTDPETDKIILLRREDDTIDDEIDKGGIALELAEGIKGLDFKYYDDKGEEFNEWYSDDTKNAPKMVKITLSLEDENKNRLDFSTMVCIEMSGG